jgi:K+-dependent Na+/Ca+ exchanger-like protein
MIIGKLDLRGRRRAILPVQIGIFFVVVGSSALYTYLASDSTSDLQFSRKLSNATPASVIVDDGTGDYPADLFLTKPYVESENKGALVLHILGILYMFFGLALVCDEYFAAALEEIVKHYDITEDVAGATWMAAGGSAPELFTSIMGVFVAKSDVGFGTIVGSAVFNVLFVIGLCGVFAKTALKLTWWPLFRDCNYYIFGLSVLVAFVSTGKTEKAGGRIDGWEAIILFLLYIGYVTVMKFNERLKAFFSRLLGKNSQVYDVETATAEENAMNAVSRASSAAVGLRTVRDMKGVALKSMMKGQWEFKEIPTENSSKLIRRGSARERFQAAVRFIGHQAIMEKRRSARELEGLDEDTEASTGTTGQTIDDIVAKNSQIVEGPEEDDDEGGADPFSIPDSPTEKFMFFLTWPIVFSCWATIPDCTEEGKEYKFFRTFGMSLVWIAIYAFCMVWWSAVVGAAFGISPPVMGLTILAAGTSIPDALSSVIVARQGFGDMAVSSSIGSNVFDILVGLPVPWILKTCIVDPAETGELGVIGIQSESIAVQVITLICMVLFVIVSIISTGWVLDKNLGLIMFVLYILFVIWSLLLEGGTIKL